jgi:branched-chain amino acid transport system substrate-binding protein
MGVANRAGVEFAAQEINNAGGIKSLGGAQIKLVVADTQSDPKVAQTEAERLLAQEKVSILLGPLLPAAINQTGLLAEQYKTPNVAFGRMDQLVPKNLNFVRSIRPLAKDGFTPYTTFLRQFADEYKVKMDRIVLLLPDDHLGRSILDPVLRQGLKQVGLLDSTLPTMFADQEAPEQSSNLLRLKAMNPDAVIAVQYGGAAYEWHKARVALDYTPPIFIGHLWPYSSRRPWKEISPEIAQAALVHPGVFGSDQMSLRIKYKPQEDFLARASAFAQSKGMVAADVEFLTGAQAIYVAIAALEQAASRDRERINQAMRGLSLPAGDPRMIFALFSPALEFQPSGGLKHTGLFLGRWDQKGENFEIVFPKEFRTAEAWLK